MASVDVQTIVSSLALLSIKDVEAVHSASGFLLNKMPNKQTAPPERDQLFDPMMAALTAYGLGNFGYSRFTQTSYFKAYQKNIPIVLGFVEVNFKEVKTRNGQYALIRFLITTLVDHMKQTKTPVSLGTVVRNLTRLPQAFDAAFPGYLASNLQHLIPKMLKIR